jgi:hypothetical protein
LITISTRTIISAFYPIEILGFFTLANSISYATLLGLQTVGWLIYPEVLTRTTENNSTGDTRQTINRINILYNTACYLMVFVLIIFLPLVLLFIPQYRSALPIITIMVISQAVLSSSYGFNALATSRKKQNIIALIGLGVVLFIICFGTSISLLHWNPTWIAILLLMGSFIYTALQVKIGTSILGLKQEWGKEIQNIFPLSIILTIAICIAGSYTSYPIFASLVACSIFIFTNLPKIKESFSYLKELVKK